MLVSCQGIILDPSCTSARIGRYQYTLMSELKNSRSMSFEARECCDLLLGWAQETWALQGSRVWLTTCPDLVWILVWLAISRTIDSWDLDLIVLRFWPSTTTSLSSRTKLILGEVYERVSLVQIWMEIVYLLRVDCVDFGLWISYFKVLQVRYKIIRKELNNYTSIGCISSIQGSCFKFETQNMNVTAKDWFAKVLVYPLKSKIPSRAAEV